MVDINKGYHSKYVRSCDLEEQDLVVTIASVEIDGFKSDDDEFKPLMYFEDGLPLVLNKTNAHTISGLYGSDTDHWIGKQIILHCDETDFGGKRVKCIRVKSVTPVSPKAESVYQVAMRHIVSLQAAPNDANDVAKVLVRLEEQHAAKLLKKDEYTELVKLAEKLPQLPSSDVNDDLPF